MKGAIAGYYKWVNEHNRVAFANLLPARTRRRSRSTSGTDACSKCHEEPREVWNGTRHSRAYKTLVDQDKQFNLDCVSCHVTGYDQPGGSTVTHVAKLENVGCENCHGPGSKHALDPKRVHTLIPSRRATAASAATTRRTSRGSTPRRRWPTSSGRGTGSEMKNGRDAVSRARPLFAQTLTGRSRRPLGTRR